MNVADPIAIRPYQLTDTHFLSEAVVESRQDLEPWLPWCHSSYDQTDAEGWVSAQLAAFEAKTEYAFVVVDATGAFLGGCGLNRFDRTDRCANLGYWIRSSCVGRGVATRAVRLLREWAFANDSFERLEIVADVANLASRRVAEKCGAQFEGILRARLFRGGSMRDAALYGIVRADVRSVG